MGLVEKWKRDFPPRRAESPHTRPPVHPLSFIFFKNVPSFCYAYRSLVVSFPTNRDHSFPYRRNDTDLGASKLSALLTDGEKERGRKEKETKSADATTSLRVQRVRRISPWLYLVTCFVDNCINLSASNNDNGTPGREKYIHRFFSPQIFSPYCQTWYSVTTFYSRLYFPTLLHGIVVSVEELDVRNCLIAPYSLPFLSFSCRAMYFVLEYVRDEIPSELREKVCR